MPNDGYTRGRHDGYRQGYDDGWRDARYATWVPRNQITADNAGRLSRRVRVIAEGANGPTTPDADEILQERGWATAAYFVFQNGGAVLENCTVISNYGGEHTGARPGRNLLA